MDWYLKVLKQYADFTGRARRKEYWMFALFHIIFMISLLFLMIFLGENSESNSSLFLIILSIYFLITFIPSIAVTVRRLHDVDKSGWWYLINFVPYIGSFILLIFVCTDSVNRPNKWGENPKGIGNDSAINQIGRE